VETTTDQQRLEEAILVLRAQAGREAAFLRLYQRYEARLLYFLRRLTGSPEVAEDAFQETWLKVHRGLRRLDRPEAFRSWLYRIGRNAAIDALRQRGRELPLDDPRAAATIADRATEDAEDDALDAIDAAAVHAGLDRIPAIHREALTLRFLEGLSYEEIAGIVGAPTGTVRSRIHHGRRALRHEIEALRRSTHPIGGGDP
jgi:RNA polymerase sigma-70 factor (ECF subfamily)